MRFDTPLYFQLVQRGAYDENTGDYDKDIVIEHKRYAAVNSTGVNTLKLMYGEIKEGCLTVRLQRPYKENFDRIRIGEKLYKVDTQKPLENKTVFIVSEVQGSNGKLGEDGFVKIETLLDDIINLQNTFINGELL